MAPDTTLTVTLGEVARGVERVEQGQLELLRRMELMSDKFVTRREFDEFKADVEARRVPVTAVVALILSATGILAGILF